jgi:hypothetical protein
MKTSLLIILILIFISCSKEKFPKKKDLIGTWIGRTIDEFVFVKLIFTEDTLYSYTPPPLLYTYTYYLDKKNKNICFFAIDDNYSRCFKITINKSKDRLTLEDTLDKLPIQVYEKE